MLAISASLVANVFLVILVLMLALSGLFGVIVVVRMVEPRGMKALLRKLVGKPV
jgi:hypothetical protein